MSILHELTRTGEVSIQTIETPIGLLEISASDRGVERVCSVKKALEDRPNNFTRTAARQLNEYFSGERKQFDFPVEYCGTLFQRKVWMALQEIPYGGTATYSAIAEAIGRPKAVRVVGRAIGANLLLIVVPCHRVLGADGALTGYSGGMEKKAFLLALEKRYAPEN